MWLFRRKRLVQRKSRPEAASSWSFLLAYFLMASAASRAASFTSPAALWADPLALSILPSVSVSLSPLSLPAPSLMAPLALSAAPFTCSRSMIVFLRCLDQRQRRSCAVVPRRTRDGLAPDVLSFADPDVNARQLPLL